MRPNLKILSLCVVMSASVIFYISGCSSSKSSPSSTTAASCSLTDDTIETSVENSYGCKLLTRDTTSCQTSRTNQGLTGFWLKFSCRVTLTKSGANVVIETDGQPDHMSQYFDSSDGCYEAFSAGGRFTNPNKIASQSIRMTVPFSPADAGSTSAMAGGAVGITVDGVVIYDNEAAPGDNIYDEVASFDKCEGHPDNRGMYHYHTEPVAISNEDNNFVGVFRDGFPVYGREDAGSATPVGLDSAQGHTGTTVDSGGGTVYHYHVSLQTDGTDTAYFITDGKYTGTAGVCTGC